MIQRALRIRVSGFEPLVDLRCAKVFSPFWTRTLASCLCRFFRRRLRFWRRLSCQNCLLCCHSTRETCNQGFADRCRNCNTGHCKRLYSTSYPTRGAYFGGSYYPTSRIWSQRTCKGSASYDWESPLACSNQSPSDSACGIGDDFLRYRRCSSRDRHVDDDRSGSRTETHSGSQSR